MNLLARVFSTLMHRIPRHPKAGWYMLALVGIVLTVVTGPQTPDRLTDRITDRITNPIVLTTIQIMAAGSEGEEVMELRIDDNIVGTWTVGGDAENGQFQEFIYTTTDPVSADQVRIYFTNDLWIPEQGIDRNLRVDAITINGNRFETDDPSVYSTGTWLPGDGVQPGFWESEWLDTNGYFQYASNNNDDTLIEIFARGNEGVEEFNLRIDGTEVGSYTTTTADQLFTYTTTDSVTAAQIQIEFSNDLWDPNNGIDNNLFVDWISIDGQTFQTEDPSVYSTGTWLPEDGIQPGFRESEWLHVNGYFQYAASNNIAGELRLVTSVYSVSESAEFVNVEILRENGAVGAVSIEYDTLDITATAGQDYTAVSGTVFWADGESGVRVVSIPMADDGNIEDDEQFSFTIDNPAGDAVLLVPRTATITIDDNDSVTGQGDGLIWDRVSCEISASTQTATSAMSRRSQPKRRLLLT